MTEESSFPDFLRRMRAGDELAWREFDQRYGKMIQMMIRRKLTNRRYRRMLDSMDITQSVLLKLFLGLAQGEFKLDTEEEMRRLVAKITSNRFRDWIRKLEADRRNPQHVQDGDPDQMECIDPSPSPSQEVSAQELVREIRLRLTPEELQLLDLRSSGCTWEEIARKVGGTPDQVRMQLSRALERVRREMDKSD
jgi:RNA polymerase sigma factor (sigma-70 family)